MQVREGPPCFAKYFLIFSPPRELNSNVCGLNNFFFSKMYESAWFKCISSVNSVFASIKYLAYITPVYISVFKYHSVSRIRQIADLYSVRIKTFSPLGNHEFSTFDEDVWRSLFDQNIKLCPHNSLWKT